MITTEKKSNKIQRKLKFVKYYKVKVFGSNRTEIYGFYTELYY